MNADWAFSGNGIGIQKGLKILAKNGTLGVTAALELYLYNDAGQVIDHAPLSQAVVKLGSMAGDTVKMNGNKYMLVFVPQPKTSAFGLAGGVAAGMQYGQMLRECAKRNEFMALIERVQVTNA